MSDAFASWRAALAGGKPPIHDGIYWAGYFKTRDHTATKMNGRQWPQVACAIWPDGSGGFKAERAGVAVPVNWIFPHCAARPVSFEDYQFWHQNHTWPEAVAA